MPASMRSRSPPGSTTAPAFVASSHNSVQFCWNGVTGTMAALSGMCEMGLVVDAALSYLTSLRRSTRGLRISDRHGVVGAARGRHRGFSSIPELLGENALVQAVTGVEHHEEVDPAGLFHLHPRHGACFGVVGHCAHRA